MAKIHISEDTREHFGPISEEFSGWADSQGVSQVLVVTPNDIIGHIPEVFRETDGSAPKPFALREGLKAFLEQHPDFPIEALREKIGGATDKEFQEKLLEKIMDGSAESIPLDTDRDGKNDAGVIIAPAYETSKMDIAATITGVSPTSLENITGTDKDWQAFVTAHEFGHLGQLTGQPVTMFHEAEAEQNGIAFYQGAFEKGLVTDPTLADNVTLLRSLGGGLGTGISPTHFSIGTHDIGPAVTTPSETPIDGPPDWRSYLLAMDETRSLAAIEAIKITGGEADVEAYTRSMIEPGDYSEEARDAIERFKRSEISATDLSGQLSGDDAARFTDMMRTSTVAIGRGILSQNSAMAFETMSRLYRQGAFDDNPVGKQYVHEYLEAARRFAPSLHGVADPDQKFNPPTAAITRRDGALNPALKMDVAP